LRVNCIKKQTEVLPHSPMVPQSRDVFDEFIPSETKLQFPPNLNMKHYKSDVCSNFRMSSSTAQIQSPPCL